MDTAQSTQIRNYLLSKNLPIDLMIEVQDHFIAQILDLEKEGLTFEEAFEKTQNSWFSELRFSRFKIQFDLRDRTYFEKRIKEQQQLYLVKRSVFATAFTGVLLAVSAYVLSEKSFHYAFIIAIAAVILIPVVQYFQHQKLFKLAKKYSNYTLTLSHSATGLALVLAGSSASFLYNVSAHTHALYQTFHNPRLDIGVVTVLILLFLFLLNSYCFFAQRNYLRQITQIQPFLQYLKVS